LAAVPHERNRVGHGVEDSLHARSHLDRCLVCLDGQLLGGAHEVEQVGAFDVVELQGACDGVEDVFGDAADVAPLELRVVLGADPGDHGDLFAA